MPRFLWASLVLAGCASTTFFPDDGEAETAPNVPEQFLVGTPSGRARFEIVPEGACQAVMVDPRDGARLTLVRTARQRGDYDVPSGRYSVAADQLLRLECGTGRVVGRVPRW